MHNASDMSYCVSDFGTQVRVKSLMYLMGMRFRHVLFSSQLVRYQVRAHGWPDFGKMRVVRMRYQTATSGVRCTWACLAGDNSVGA